jgi:hypothetical protein
MGATHVHEEPHLTIGDVAAGQKIDPRGREKRSLPAPLPSDETPSEFRRRRGDIYSRATPFFRYPRGGILILIVALFSS